MSIAYFKTLDQAAKQLKSYENKQFINRFQSKQESTMAQLREFSKGYAIQFGDYGDYLESNHV